MPKEIAKMSNTFSNTAQKTNYSQGYRMWIKSRWKWKNNTFGIWLDDIISSFNLIYLEDMYLDNWSAWTDKLIDQYVQLN